MLKRLVDLNQSLRLIYNTQLIRIPDDCVMTEYLT